MPVYYDPADPALCTLTIGVPRRLWSYYAIAATFAVIGLVLLVNLLAEVAA